MTIDIQQIEELNKKAQQLNAERQRQLGIKESARASYDKAVYAYAQKFGVQLDDTNLQDEYTKVKEGLMQQAEEQKKIITDIEQGVHKNNQIIENAGAPPQQQQTQQQQTQFATPHPQTQQQVNQAQQQQTQAQYQQPSFTPPQVAMNEQTMNQIYAQTNNFNENQQQQQTQQQNNNTYQDPNQQQHTQQPQTPQEKPDFGQFQAPPQIAPMQNQGQQPQGGQDDVDPSEQAFTPEGWGTPVQDINQNFSNILNGGGNGNGQGGFGL